MSLIIRILGTFSTEVHSKTRYLPISSSGYCKTMILPRANETITFKHSTRVRRQFLVCLKRLELLGFGNSNLTIFPFILYYTQRININNKHRTFRGFMKLRAISDLFSSFFTL